MVSNFRYLYKFRCYTKRHVCKISKTAEKNGIISVISLCFRVIFSQFLIVKKMEQIKNYEAQLDRELSKYPLIVKLEKECNVPKTYLVAGSVALLSLMMLFNVWGKLLSNLVAWGYPGMY